MNTHPVIPLTAETKLAYRRISRARGKLSRSNDIEQRIAMRNEIGKRTAELWQMARKRGDSPTPTQEQA